MEIEDIEVRNVSEKARRNNYTELISACANGQYEMVQNLLLSGANQMKTNKFGRTALMCAAGNGHIRCTKLLLDVARSEHILKELVFFQDSAGKNALDWARLAHQHDIAKVLETAMEGVFINIRIKKQKQHQIENFRRILVENRERRMHMEDALMRKDLNSIRGLCSPLLSANVKAGTGDFVLKMHSIEGYSQKNDQLSDIENPLIGEASRMAFNRALSELSQDSPDPQPTRSTTGPHKITFRQAGHVYFADHECERGETALLLAVANDDPDLVAALIRKSGANIDYESSRLYQTALTWACVSGCVRSVAILLREGANLDHQTQKEKMTALMHACKNAHVEIVSQLLDHALLTALRNEAFEAKRQYDGLKNVMGHELAAAVRYTTTGAVPGDGWHRLMKHSINDLVDWEGRQAKNFAEIASQNTKGDSQILRRATLIIDMVNNAVNRVEERFEKLLEMKRNAALLKCTFGCKQWIRADQMERHQRIKCRKRLLSCNLCNKIMPADAIHLHQKNDCTHRFVRCRNHCGKEIEAHLREVHESHHCKKRVVFCRLECGTKLIYEDRALHEVDFCPERFIQCIKCNKNMQAKEENVHTYQHCPFRLVFCGRGCNMRMTELLRASHEEEECILRPLPCRYRHFGCSEVLAPPDRRKIHEAHLCAYRTILCKNNCGHLCFAHDMPKHIADECPNRLVACRNGCGEFIMAKDLDQHERRGETGLCPNRFVRCRRDWVGNRLYAHRIVGKGGNTRPAWTVGVVKKFDLTKAQGKDHKASMHGRFLVRFDDETIWLNVGAPYNLFSVGTMDGDEWICGWVRAHERINHENYTCAHRLVKCSLGCNQFLPAGQLAYHEKNRCPHRNVNCENCNSVVPLKTMSDHNADFCPKRLVECPDCDELVVEEDLFDHQREVCTSIKERCPNGCGKHVRRNKLENHLAEGCTKRVVVCKWKCGRQMFADAQNDHETARCLLRQDLCEHKCGEFVPFFDRENHWETNCSQRPIPCPQCSDLIVCEKLALHIKMECRRRLYTCFAGCKMKIAVEDRLKHERDICKHRPLICPLGCGRVLRADKANEHTAYHCRRRIVRCPHGCDDIVRAEEEEDHWIRCGMRPITCGAGSKHCMRQQRAWKKDVNGAQRLVKCEQHKSTGLHRACSIGDYALVEIMLSGLPPSDVNYEDPTGTTPLTIASFRGHAKICRMLIHSGAEIDRVTVRGRFPLLEAVRENQTDATKVLINEGANMHLQNGYKVNAMGVAKRCKYKEVLEYMETFERLRQDHRKLLVAISCDDWNSVKRLTSGGEPHKFGHIQILNEEKPLRKAEAIEYRKKVIYFEQEMNNMKQRYKDCKLVVDKDLLSLKEIAENKKMIKEEQWRWERDSVLAMDGVAIQLRALRALDVAQVLSLGGNPAPAVKGILKGLCLLRDVKPGRKSVVQKTLSGETKTVVIDDWVGPAYALLTDRSLLRFLRRFDPEKAAQMNESTVHALREIVLSFPNLHDELADLGQEFLLLNSIASWIQTCLFLIRKEHMVSALIDGMVKLMKEEEDVTAHITPYRMQFNYLANELKGMEEEVTLYRETADIAEARYNGIDRAIWVSRLLSFRSASRHTALTWSASRDNANIEITKELILCGAPIDTNTDEEILVAKVIQMLARHRSWMKTRGVWTPARAHAFRLRELGHEFALKGALKLLKDERMTSRNVLAEAFFNGNFEVAQFLLDNGAKAWRPVYVLPSGHAPHRYPCPSSEVSDDKRMTADGSTVNVEVGKSSMLRSVHVYLFDKPKTIVEIARLGAKLYGRQNFSEKANGWISCIESKHQLSAERAHEWIVKRLNDADGAERDRQVRIQMREQADREQRIGREKMHKAVHSYNFEEVIRLADEEHIAIDILTFENYTGLGLAASEGTKATNDQGKRVFAVELLLDRPPGKIRPTVDREAYGMTPLMWAANNGHVEVVEALLERGADVNYASKDPPPPHILPPQSSFDCDGEASAAMVLAEEKRWKKRYKVSSSIGPLEEQHRQSMLVVAPSNPEEEEDLQQIGKTPLILATCNNKSSVAWLLVQHGANLNARDSTDRSALDWAAVLGRHGILQMLTQARINFFGDARGRGLPPSYLSCSYGCGKRLPIKLKEKHEKEACPKRPVSCPQDCGLENIWAEELESHLLECENRPSKCLLGCGEVMGLLSMPNHIAYLCPHRTVCCTFDCGKELGWRHLEMHLKQWCPNRPLTCTFNCGTTIPAKEMKKHKKICEYRIVRCRNLCGNEMPWNMRREHERNDCPERWVSCKWTGCEGCLAKKQQVHEVEECSFRIIACTCGEAVLAKDFGKHEKEICTKRIVKCRSKECKFRFPLCEREHHEKHECEYRLVRCDFIYVDKSTVLTDDDLYPEGDEDFMLRRRSLSRNVKTFQDIGMQQMNDEKMKLKTPIKMKVQSLKTRIHGCNELVRFYNMETHWVRECKKRAVLCGNDCGKFILVCDMEAHKKNNCVKRVVSCRLGCYKNMKEEDREYHETWECKQRQVYCSLGCGFQIQEVRRKLHEKCDCRLRFVECPNGCRETMRFEDLDFHMSNQCSHREYHPPKEDWKCSRCNMKNLKNKMILSYGDDVFAWKCQVCKNAYAKKGLKVVDVLKHKYSL